MTEKNSKHTPGPWTQQGYRVTAMNTGDIIAVRGASPVTLEQCIVQRADGRTEDEAKANAARIVVCVNACEGINPKAVPELLEALTAIVKADDIERAVLVEFGKEDIGERLLIRLARAAIAKAKEG